MQPAPFTDAERQANSAIVRTAHEADALWQAELVRLYGARAGCARYDERGTCTAKLAELYADKRAAQDAEHAMWEACRARAVATIREAR